MLSKYKVLLKPISAAELVKLSPESIGSIADRDDLLALLIEQSAFIESGPVAIHLKRMAVAVRGRATALRSLSQSLAK